MKNYSYLTLLIATTAGLGIIFGFIVWRSSIDENTFLSSSTLKIMLLSVFILALLPFFGILKWGKGKKPQSPDDYLKLYAGSVIIVTLLSYLLLINAAWLLPGQITSYTATYEFSASGRHSCAGASFYDPDLKKSIKVCKPAGDYFTNKTIRVTKRSNMLGMVVIYAKTAPIANGSTPGTPDLSLTPVSRQ
ncbi:hypothetical protein SC171_10590 [Pantoea cypripedii]|uniref:hypothetical protein n=1 Tax=Pantoea cypripedii TaxID=55209 RepID=UPI002FC76CE4